MLRILLGARSEGQENPSPALPREGDLRGKERGARG